MMTNWFKQNNFLGMPNAWNDIKTIKTYFKIFLIIGAVFILFFNFFSITNDQGTYFQPLQTYRKFLDPEQATIFGSGSKTNAIVVTVLYSLSGVTSLTGLLAIAMIVEGKTSQFFWQMINSIFYGAFALSVGYTGDFLMNIILFVGCPIGWYLFQYKGHVHGIEEEHSLKYNIFFVIGLLVSGFIVVMFWYWAIPSATDMFFGAGHYNAVETPQLHILDALANGGNTIGFSLQLLNSSKQFYVWFIVDTLKFLKFTGIAPDTFTITMLIQFAIWFGTDFIGIYERHFKNYLSTKHKQHQEIVPNDDNVVEKSSDEIVNNK